MGYNTDFVGELKFNSELSWEHKLCLESMLGEDCRDHPEWDAGYLTHIDLDYTDDHTALTWNGTEKSYDMVEKINLILKEMRKRWPDFGVSGQFIAQGEEVKDRWAIIINEDGWAERREVEDKIL